MVLCFLLVTGCGGGGGGGGDDGDPIDPGGTATLEGVAAGGAPLEGTVTVRDAVGETLTETVALDGTFAFDTSGMTPPFLVWAEGTVDGAPATYYAACDSDGRINLTPLTHLAMAMALGQDPVDYYRNNPGAPPPDPVDLEEAAQMIGDLLAGRYADLGIPSDFDLMTDAFAADGTGFDQLLETITVTLQGNACSLYEHQSGQTLLADDDMSDDRAPSILPMGMAAARAYYAQVQSAYADGVADANEQAGLVAWMADDIIDRGRDIERVSADIATGTSLPAGIRLEVIGLHRLMYGNPGHPLGPLGGISEKGGYEIGFWCAVRVHDRDRAYQKFAAFVLEGDQWKMFGDRVPFNSWNTVVPMGSVLYYGNTSVVNSGLALSVNDVGRSGHALGVERVLIANSALPAITNPFGAGSLNAVLLERDATDLTGEEFRIIQPEALLGDTSFLDSDGLNPAALAGNTEFLHVAMNAANQPLYCWATRLWELPYAVSQLSSNINRFFPVLTAVGSGPAGTMLSMDQLAGGPVPVWSAPTDADVHPSGGRVQWRNSYSFDSQGLIGAQAIFNPAHWAYDVNFRDWTTQAFDPPPEAWNGSCGRLSIWSSNASGHIFVYGIQYRVATPATPE
jgi:hypothetical protein